MICNVQKISSEAALAMAVDRSLVSLECIPIASFSVTAPHLFSDTIKLKNVSFRGRYKNQPRSGEKSLFSE